MGRKDLIEALQELEQRRRSPAPSEPVASAVNAPPAETPPPPPPVARRTEPSGAPKLERVPEPAIEPATPAHLRPGGERLAGLREFGRPLVLVALLAAFALGFLLGNSRRPIAAAAEGGSLNLAARDPRPALDPAASGSAAAPTDASIEAALVDPANRFTIQAISYDDTPTNRQLAAATAGTFRSAGLPAADPRRSGRYVVVVIGAAPTREALEGLCDRVRTMPDASGNAGAFSGARISEIDRLFPN